MMYFKNHSDIKCAENRSTSGVMYKTYCSGVSLFQSGLRSRSDFGGVGLSNPLDYERTRA